METKKHILLKEHAKKLLLTNGFEAKDIIFEYKVKISDNKYYIVDVVGIVINLNKYEDRIIKLYGALKFQRSKEVSIKELINTHAKEYVKQNLR